MAPEIDAPRRELTADESVDDAAIFTAIIAWLEKHGLSTECLEQTTWLEGDILRIAQGTPHLEPENLAPLVVRKLGRNDSTAYCEAAWALAEAAHKFGPITAAAEVDACLERAVRWAEGRTRQRLALRNVARPELYYRLGVARRPPRSITCSWTRPRPSRASRSRRRTTRARARSPGRLSGGDDPEPDLACHPVGRRA